MMMTFLALLLAHLAADFLLPARGGLPRFALHIAAAVLLSAAALGGAWPLALAAAAAHAVIQTATRVLPDTLATFAAGQGAHIASLVALAHWQPGAFGSGLWAGLPLAQPYILTAGLLATTLAGGAAVGTLMRGFDHALPGALPHAGWWIGVLERGLIFLIVLLGEPAGIGFLIAAKSVLRFDAAKNAASSEYVIIGTLASFGWALAMALLTLQALEIMPRAP